MITMGQGYFDTRSPDKPLANGLHCGISFNRSRED